MMGGVSPETRWASYKYGIKFDTLLHLVGFSMWIIHIFSLIESKWPLISTTNIYTVTRVSYSSGEQDSCRLQYDLASQEDLDTEDTHSNTARNMGNCTPIDKASHSRRRAYSAFILCQYKQIHDILQHPTWLC